VLPVPSAPRVSRLAALVLLLGAVASCSSNSLAPFRPQITNAADHFQLQTTNVSDATTTLTYAWAHSGAQATINHATTTSAATTLVVIKDNAGTTVYSKALAASLNEPTSAGQAGTWSIPLTLTNHSGTLHSPAQKL
jgi:hypothetical protein